MRETFTTILELAGAALVAAGAWQASRPAGLIVGGLSLAGIGYLTDSRPPDVPPDVPQ